jgi:glycosyltransferase involved in cell wall biosynthesis
MRILAICSYAGLGGCERSFGLLLQHLPGEANPAALVLGDGPLRATLTASGIPTSAAPEFARRPGPRDITRFTRLLYPKLRRENPQVVWASGQKAALLAGPASRLAGVPMVWHKVDFSFDRWLALPLAAVATGVTSVSNAAAAPVGPLRRGRFLGVIAPPVRPMRPATEGGPPSEPTIGTLGRLVPYKGHHRIIQAAALLRDEFPDIRVLIAGVPVPEYPEYPAKLEDLAVRLAMDDRVVLAGLVDDVDGVLARLSVFVSATYRDVDGFGLEGRGRAIIEASSAGLPVVASSAGGARESVIEGRTGTLVDESRPELLADAIAPYLRDSELAQRAGREGRAYARANFSPHTLGRKLYEVLRAVAKGGGR